MDHIRWCNFLCVCVGEYKWLLSRIYDLSTDSMGFDIFDIMDIVNIFDKFDIFDIDNIEHMDNINYIDNIKYIDDIKKSSNKIENVSTLSNPSIIPRFWIFMIQIMQIQFNQYFINCFKMTKKNRISKTRKKNANVKWKKILLDVFRNKLDKEKQMCSWLAYVKQGCTLIQVLPVPNVYTKTYWCLLMHICICIEMRLNASTPPPICIHIQCHFSYKCIYAWAGNNRICCMFWGRKYLNECTPFSDVKQWVDHTVSTWLFACILCLIHLSFFKHID